MQESVNGDATLEQNAAHGEKTRDTTDQAINGSSSSTEEAVGGSPPAASAAEARPSLLQRLKAHVELFKHSVLALYFAGKDPECGWLPRLVAIIAVSYALSPLDLIPDFIPVLGFLDDIILLTALLWLAMKLIPDHVWARAKERAATESLQLSSCWGMALFFFLLWDAFLLWMVWLGVVHWGGPRLRGEWLPAVLGGTAAALVLAEGGWLVWEVRRERRKDGAAPSPTGPEAAVPLLAEEDGRGPDDP